MAQQHTYTDAYRPQAASLIMPDLTHLAVGDGAVTGAPSPAALGLLHEIGRVKYVTRDFVTPQTGGGLVFDGVEYGVSQTATRFVYFMFRFLDDEALGNWTELGLFGAGVTYAGQAATLVASGVSGDDVVNRDVILGGQWAAPVSGELDVSVVTGGGSGLAQISWSDPANIVGGGAGPIPVYFNSPINLGTSGVSILFTGGNDGVLTPGDRWRILGTIATTRPEYASGGVYDPNANPAGQVLDPGIMMRLTYISPVQDKINVEIDVSLIVEVIRP